MSDWWDKSDKSDGSDGWDGSDGSDKSDKSDKSDEWDGSDRSDGSDKSDGWDRSDGSDKSDGSDEWDGSYALPKLTATKIAPLPGCHQQEVLYIGHRYADGRCLWIEHPSGAPRMSPPWYTITLPLKCVTPCIVGIVEQGMMGKKVTLWK